MEFPRHFDGKRFFNPGGKRAPGLSDVLRWKLTSHKTKSPEHVSDVEPSIPPRRLEGGALRVTLVNHSTVLLQQSGLNILTDPIWSERASPLSSFGPRRHRDPGVRKKDLPPIDIVLLSHNHYDHLDLPTLRWLDRRADCAFVAPIGVAKRLRSEKIGPVHELDWGEAHRVGETAITSVPAFHFSARGIFDRNKTLWCGYVIQSGKRTLYFAGDTAFGSHFSLIKDMFGPPSLALLPVGAYEPRWFMSPVHMAPEEALKAHEILGSKMSIGIHHGTFQLADEGIDQAAQELAKSENPHSILMLANGQSLVLA